MYVYIYTCAIEPGFSEINREMPRQLVMGGYVLPHMNVFTVPYFHHKFQSRKYSRAFYGVKTMKIYIRYAELIIFQVR